MAKNRIIRVQDIPITVSEADMDDYICITDMAAAKSENSRAADVVRNWLRNRSTLEFLSTWEEIYNPDFKVFESEHFKKQAGLVVFTPSVSEWQLAQEKRKANNFKREKVHDIEHAYILSGLLKCPCCKSLYGNIAKAHSKDKYTRYYYYCKNTLGATGHKCSFRLNSIFNIIFLTVLIRVFMM